MDWREAWQGSLVFDEPSFKAGNLEVFRTRIRNVIRIWNGGTLRPLVNLAIKVCVAYSVFVGIGFDVETTIKAGKPFSVMVDLIVLFPGHLVDWTTLEEEDEGIAFLLNILPACHRTPRDIGIATKDISASGLNHRHRWPSNTQNSNIFWYLSWFFGFGCFGSGMWANKGVGFIMNKIVT